jgi:iron complex transport system substrate-binding protein
MRLLALALVLAGCGRGDSPAPAPAAGSATATAGVSRIVSLSPSATEVVWELGAGAQLVGVDDYSTFPDYVAKLPKVGSFLAPNLEAIVALRPTLVIVDDVHGQVAGALRDAGIATIACPMHSLPDVKAALRAVGERIGHARDAARVMEHIDGNLDDFAAHRPAHHPSVLAIIDREPSGLGGMVSIGPGSWLDELLAVVGGDNVLAHASVRYPKISIEEVLRARPDVIIDVSFGAKLDAWQDVEVPAVARHRVRVLAAPYLRAPSPRVDEALAALYFAIQ